MVDCTFPLCLKGSCNKDSTLLHDGVSLYLPLGINQFYSERLFKNIKISCIIGINQFPVYP